MALPRHRNIKKAKRRTGRTVRDRRVMLDRSPLEAPISTFEERLSEIQRPGDYLETEYLEQPTIEDRLFSLHRSNLLDRDEDYNPDIGSDFDRSPDTEDVEDFI